jgi:1-phosphofructokinase family hexose kinase
VILTVTLNLALDITYWVDRLNVAGTNRVRDAREQVGGKGVNVARILTALDVPVLATGFCGGAVGRRVAEDLLSSGIEQALVEAEGETRRCVAIVAGDGTVTEVTEPGPEIQETDWNRFLEAWRSLLENRPIRVVVLSGSLPPGLRDDAYAELCADADRRGIPAILDTSGPALTAGLRGRPAVVKPNRAELVEAVGISMDSTAEPAAWLPSLEALRKAGARSVVASFGSDGLVALTGEGAWHAMTPAVEGNPVGAGDAVAAALARGELDAASWPERLVEAAALSCASVAGSTAGTFDPLVFERTLRHVALSELSP